MDRSLVLSDVGETMMLKKATQKKKSCKKMKNQPLKVVYISNPMRVHTSASEFRALVQELTGRDAEFPDPAKFHRRQRRPSLHAQETNLEKKWELGDDDYEEAFLDVAATEDSNDHFLETSYESFEEMLTREMMMDNLVGDWTGTLMPLKTASC